MTLTDESGSPWEAVLVDGSDPTERSEWFASARDLPLRWSKDLPDGGYLGLRAGGLDGRFAFFMERREPGPFGKSSGSGGWFREGGLGGEAPYLAEPKRVQIHGRSRKRGPGQDEMHGYAVGQVTKAISAIEAVLDDGETVAGEVVRAEDLPVNVFVVVAPPGRTVAAVHPSAAA